jgi:hypothetical protein
MFFNIPGNKVWLNERILNFTDNIYDELDMMSLEDRRIYRLGGTYIGSVAIKKSVATIDVKAPLILLPPTDYLKSHGIDAAMPEPIVFYYYTGLQAVQATSSNVLESNIALIASRNKMLDVVKMKNELAVKDVLKEYKSPQ